MADGTVKTDPQKVDPRKKGEPEIRAINFWDEENNQPLDGTSIQYVNLSKDENKDLVGDAYGINSTNQLGRFFNFKVIFNQKGKHPFNVYLIKRPIKFKPKFEYNNVEYRKPNSNLKHEEKVQKYETENDGKIIIDSAKNDKKIFVSAAGEDRFTLFATATTGKKNTKTLVIQTMRMFFVKRLAITGLKSYHNISNAMRHTVEEYKQYGIILNQIMNSDIITLDECGGKTFFGDCSDSDMTILRNICETSIQSNNPSIKKFYIPILFVDRLVNKTTLRLVNHIGSRHIIAEGVQRFKIKDSSNEQKILWNKIEPNNWLVECSFTPDGSSKKKDLKDKCSIEENRNGETIVKVNFSSVGVVPGNIKLVVNIIKDMQAGYSLNDENGKSIGAVVIATRHPADDNSIFGPLFMCSTIVHEIGHILGIAPSNLESGAINPHHYSGEKGREHAGNHCNFGLEENRKNSDTYTDEDVNKAKCVMFGEPGGGNGGDLIIKFCENCAMELRKLDLSKGLR